MKSDDINTIWIILFIIIFFNIILISNFIVEGSEIVKRNIYSSSDDRFGDQKFYSTSCKMRKTNLLGFGTFLNGADDYRCYRSYCYFDTSFLGDISIIHNVSLSLYVVPISYNKTFDFDVIIQRGITEDYPHRPAENSDFNRIYYVGNGGSFNTSDISKPGDYINITLTNFSWINKNGWTKLCLRSSDDINDQWRGTSYFATNSGSNDSRKPTLTITYEDFGPIVDFSYEPAIPKENESVTFNDSSVDLNGYLVNWLWDFGDGTFSNQRNTTHSFSKFQSYNVTLYVEDNDGYINNKTQEIILKKIYTNLTGENHLTTIDLRKYLDTIITANTTSEQVVSTTLFSNNPTGKKISNGINSLGKFLDIKFENEEMINWPINITIFYSQDELDEQGINENQIVGIYFWNETKNDWDIFNETGVNTSYNENCYEGYTWARVWHLTNITVGTDEISPKINDYIFPMECTTGDSVLVSLNVTDNFKISKFEIEIQDNFFNMNRYGDIFSYIITAPLNSTNDIIYRCNFSDTANNYILTEEKIISVYDDDPPVISNISCNKSIISQSFYVNVTAIVEDNIELNDVKLIVNGPQGFGSINASMINNNFFYFNTSILFSGYYDYYIWADDINHNSKKSEIFNFSVELPNIPPLIPSNPYPVNNSVEVGLNIFLSWDCIDPNGDSLLYNVYFGNVSPPHIVSINQSENIYLTSNLENYTIYYWRIIATDNNGSTIGPIWKFRTGNISFNHEPNPPSLIYPLNDSNEVNINPILNVLVSDPDGDSLYVIFKNYNGNQIIGTKYVYNNSNASISWSGLQYETTYHWYVIINDSRNETLSDIWNFKTVVSPGNNGDGDDDDDGSGNNGGGNGNGNNGGNGNGGVPSSDGMGGIDVSEIEDDEIINLKPVADASASQTLGYINEPVKFDASNSFDSDGNIISWIWKIGNDVTYEGIKIDHIFNKSGQYNVSLLVIDDDYESDEDYILVNIVKPNRPPTIPSIEGPLNGQINKSYLYRLVSSDPDDDNILYILDWGDKTNKTIIQNIKPNISITAVHKWRNAGIYDLQLKANDGKTDSEIKSITVLINVKFIDTIGYLLDENNDGIYDSFYSNITGNKTDVIFDLKNGAYLIDSDLDGIPDLIYDFTHDTLLPYNLDADRTKDIFIEIPWQNIFYYILLPSILVIPIILIIYYLNKKLKRIKIKIKYKDNTKNRDKKLWGQGSAVRVNKIKPPRITTILSHRIKSFFKNKHNTQKNSIIHKLKFSEKKFIHQKKIKIKKNYQRKIFKPSIFKKEFVGYNRPKKFKKNKSQIFKRKHPVNPFIRKEKKFFKDRFPLRKNNFYYKKPKPYFNNKKIKKQKQKHNKLSKLIFSKPKDDSKKIGEHLSNTPVLNETYFKYSKRRKIILKENPKIDNLIQTKDLNQLKIPNYSKNQKIAFNQERRLNYDKKEDSHKLSARRKKQNYF